MNKKEKNLANNACVTYSRPPTLGNLLTNYKNIFKNETNTGIGNSRPCNKCKLCGKYGNEEGMVQETSSIKRKDGKLFNLKQNLSCSDYGIYVAQCLICNHLYVGQTKNKFSTRWNSHRKNWNDAINSIIKNTNNYNSDEQALFNHYTNYHPEKIDQEKISLARAFTVTFVEKPSTEKLDIAESMWATKLGAEINIARMCLPKHI